jgi:hypothetical protein
VASWKAVKVTDRSEEVEDDGTIVRRERERFVNELTLVFASGETVLALGGGVSNLGRAEGSRAALLAHWSSDARAQSILDTIEGVKKSASGRVTFEAVRRVALSLPNVEEGTAWGLPAFRTGGKMFLCFRQDLDAVVVRASFERRDEMIAADPETYFTTDHHRPYPWVLARISKLHPDAISDLLQMGWRFTPQKKRQTGQL